MIVITIVFIAVFIAANKFILPNLLRDADHVF